MQAIMKDGTIKEINTSYIFDNQYNTTDGKRIYDSEIQRIVDDIRLSEFYCSSVKQGTYEEVKQAIANERSQINQCRGCLWYQIDHRMEELCHKDRQENGNKLTINETTVYELSCTYKKKYGEKCVNDIDEEPKLFRDVNDCFFCRHPEGTPDMTDFVHFLIDNANKYEIVPRYSEELKYDSSFEHSKKFGSYQFEKSYYASYFELSNARNHFKFLINFFDKTFTLVDTIGYEEVKRFTTSEWIDNKSVNMPIKNWDKFTAWLFPIIDDYNASKEK